MANELATPSASEAARIELKSYNVTIPMGSLAIGLESKRLKLQPPVPTRAGSKVEETVY